MISVDGSFGEGGGQILRTSVALSAVTGKPVQISNIRARRSNPGLRPQHLTAVKAVAELCSVEVSGLSIGSSEIVFTPCEIAGGRYNFDVGTAGSITLVLQALLIPCLHAKKETIIQIRGGTDVRWSPPADYLKYVTLPLLEKFGVEAELDIVRRGYYPKGGGLVRLKIKPNRGLKSVDLTERGGIESISGLCHAHQELGKNQVIERETSIARKTLFEELSKAGEYPGEVNVRKEYVDSPSYGNGLVLWANYSNTVIGADSLGEKGKRAEEVGREAAVNLVEALKAKAPVDKYSGDQLVPYIALAPGSKLKVPEVTGHLETNIEVVKKFGYNVELEDKIIKS